MVALGWERMVRYQILSAGKHSLCDNGNDVIVGHDVCLPLSLNCEYFSMVNSTRFNDVICYDEGKMVALRS